MPVKPFVNPVHIAAQAYAGRTERPGAPAARGQVPGQTQRTEQPQGAAQSQSQGLRHSTSGVQVEISAAALEAAKRQGQQVRLPAEQPRQAAEAREAAETRKAQRAERAEEARFEASREAGRREAPFAHLRDDAPVPRSRPGSLIDITV